MATLSLQAQVSINLCLGSSTVITAVNSQGLSNPSYSMNPGGIVSQSPAFTISPASAGTYTYTLYTTGTNSNSALVTTSNAAMVTVNGVAYSITSAAAFTLGCGTQSICPVDLAGQTTPTAGGAIQYAFFPPGSSVTYSTFSGATHTNVTVPGTWTMGFYDQTYQCTYLATVNVVANNAPPVIGNIYVSQNPLTCISQTAALYPVSNPGLQYSWLIEGPGGGVNSVANPSLVVDGSSALNSTVARTPTLVLTDPVNSCQSTTVITVYQNTFSPYAIINSNVPAIGVCVNTIQLTNGSTSGVPPGTFLQTAPIVATWQGPGSQLPSGPSSSYIADTAGVYTMTATDQNNGCTNSAIYTVIADMLPPVAAFVHTVTNGVAVFNDASTGTNSNCAYYWDFGDGFTSTLQNPIHTYSSGGAHLVEFIVTKDWSCVDTVIQSVNVSGIPCVANSGFSMVPTATAQVWTVVPDDPWNVTAASWSWGDGSSSDTLYTSHQYSVAGLYNICLSVTVSCVATSSSCTSYSVYRTSQEAMILKINVKAPGLVMGLTPQEADAPLAWDIVPNPNTGDFNLNLNAIKTESLRIVICDLTGRVVHERSVDPDTTSLSVHASHLPPGLYLVTLEAGNRPRMTKRMVVDH